VRLHLTDSGVAAEAAVRRQARHLAGVALKRFCEAERRQPLALLERARSNLDALHEPR
jgi:hypothetical protein